MFDVLGVLECFVAFQENLMLLYKCFRFSDVMDQMFGVPCRVLSGLGFV